MIGWILFAAVLGAAYVGIRFQRSNRRTLIGVGLGAVAAAVGSLIPMVPLKSCTFEVDRTGADYIFGLLLLFAAATGLVVIADRSTRYLSGEDRKRRTIQEQPSKLFKTSPVVPWLLLAPSLVILSMFVYWPAVRTARLSLLRFRLGAPRSPFICVDNFTELVNPEVTFSPNFFVLMGVTAAIGAAIVLLQKTQQIHVQQNMYKRAVSLWKMLALLVVVLFFLQLASEDYGPTLLATVIISCGIVSLAITIGLAIAYLASQPVKGAKTFRTLLIWPYAVSAPIAGILFMVMFDPVVGVIDHFMEIIFGIGLPQYRKTVWLAQSVIIGASVWKVLGFDILFFIAGLQNVPKSALEAAAVDGANAWQRFKFVTLPSLAPIILFLVITNLTYSFFDLFGTVDTLTRGAPAGATSVAIYEIYRIGIELKFLGRAAAQALILFGLIIIVTIWQFRVAARRGATMGSTT